MCKVERVRLKPFNREENAGLLAEWLKRPHVARWWGDPDTQIKAVLELPAGGGDALIVSDGVSVGYIRWQRPARAELEAAGLHEIPDGAVDIDIAIGEEDYTGLGIGSGALRQLVKELATDSSIPLIMLCTSVENANAIRAYEKAGFCCKRTFFEEGLGHMWLMTIDLNCSGYTATGSE